MKTLNPGWEHGWAVLRNSPWHLAGFYPTKAQAEDHLKQAGDGYIVVYGDNRTGTDDFMYDGTDQPE